MFGIGHENVWAVSNEANLYYAISNLVSADITDPVSHSYTYDGNGNTLAKTDGINMVELPALKPMGDVQREIMEAGGLFKLAVD